MRKAKSNLTAYAYLSPALISIFVLTFLPVAYTVYISFTNYNMYHLDSYDLVGWKNYETLLNGTIKNVFFSVLGWTVGFALLSTVLSYAVGMGLAVLLNNPHMKESGIYRSLLIIPWALPATIAILSWQGLLNEQYGGINHLLETFGIEGVPWLTSVFWARAGIILVNVWLGFPYMLNVCMGGLQSISPTFYEVANVEGASKWYAFRRITLPLMFKVSIPLVVASFAANFNNFGNIYMITQGGPAKVNSQFAGSTDILASMVYKMTTWSNRYDLAATLSIFIFIIVGILTLVNLRLSGAFKE
ncbi:carbohydrate ABC transporter permease [Cohnella thailandensis]|jgi:ABC-type sugar transport systems, permease components|uniref:Maltose/maltodextrin transport system permease protein n=1 Tax=Cohnella thailandensis TaxID=557557 RepID=A0A841T3W3_9BACL|nr:sugar ABC transporter permease [Cohnella thailandensis]MBB6636547.1 sugar ABC transporter permease [Cohnella thailandensis]MBP1977580.1 arabinogalactan oligomer/maltooligosaccharide transport system permease protein [Cohnella thailandensis]